MRDDMISRQATIDEWKNDFKGYINALDIPKDDYKGIMEYIDELPSAQPGQRNARVFQGIIVEYPSISAYPEYEGKPYFSIKYTENGQEFIGYGTYKPEVLSEYIKEYFMPPTQPGWIPCTPESKPKRCEYYLVTDDGYTEEAYLDCDGVWFSRDGNKLKDVTAWMEKPEPYKGGQDERSDSET